MSLMYTNAYTQASISRAWPEPSQSLHSYGFKKKIFSSTLIVIKYINIHNPYFIHNILLEILPPGRLSCWLDGIAGPSETDVLHFQMNLCPPTHSWQPWSRELERRRKRVFNYCHLILMTQQFCLRQAWEWAACLPGLSEWMASMEEKTLLIWPLVAWWEATRTSISIATRTTVSGMLNLLTRKIKLYSPTSYRKQHGKATAARHPVGEEHLYVNLWQVRQML